MSRQIYAIELQLADGTVLQGRGRNLHATVEGMVNNATPAGPRRHVTQLKHVDPEETGYPGTYQVYLGQPNSESGTEGAVTVVAE